jgi:uncharacterized alpha-E superfamily protein
MNGPALTNADTVRQRYGNIHWKAIRAVWREVTATPCAGVRDLGDRADCSFGMAAGCLRFLRDAGYIAFEDGTYGGRRVVVPFVEQKGGGA